MANILLLESDRQIAKHTAGFLKTAGHTVTAYSDPQKAITGADKTKPDLVIISLSLAGRSGVEFLYELRSYPEWQNVPAIVTGQLTTEELASFAAGFDQLEVASYLHKPTSSLKQLLTLITDLLQKTAVA
jgi:DNA-binding response OmpR family regulator